MLPFKRLPEKQLEEMRVAELVHEGDCSGGWHDAWKAKFVEDGREFTRRFQIDGIPDGYGDAVEDRDGEYQSAYVLGHFGGEKIGTRVIDAGGVWELVQTFGGESEVECPFRTYDPETQESTSSNDPRTVHRREAQLEEKSEVRRDRPRWYGDEKPPNARHAHCIYCEERIGAEHGYLGDYVTVEVWKRIIEPPTREQMIADMADTLFLDAYANHCDDGGDDGGTGNGAPCNGCELFAYRDNGEHWKPGGGEDWADFAPPLDHRNPYTVEARAQATELAERIEKDNGAPLPELYLRAVLREEDPEEYDVDEDAPLFAHYLVMEALGHGVAWSDDHVDHELKLPDVEFYL
jgi:hypothetical protein